MAMADGMNRVTLFGNLGADPEVRHTSSGEAVVSLRVATTESYLDRNKERQERTDWHSVTVWGKRGEGLAKILSKGDKILVEGSLRTSSYERDGEKRYRTEVIAREVYLGGKGSGGGGDYGRSGAGGQAKPAAPTDYDDIPF